MMGSSSGQRRSLRRIWTAVGLAALLAAVAAVTWLVKPTGSVAAGAAPPEVAVLEEMRPRPGVDRGHHRALGSVH